MLESPDLVSQIQKLDSNVYTAFDTANVPATSTAIIKRTIFNTNIN